MGLAQELKRLRHEHADMQALGSQIRAILTMNHADGSDILLPIWQQYQRDITRHLKCEDWILYPRIEGEMPTMVQSVAADIMGAYGHLADAVARHGQLWPTLPDEEQWPDYVADIASILAVAQQRAEREERDLFPKLGFAYAPDQPVG